MGMYTGLNALVKIKPEYHDAIDCLVNRNVPNDVENLWKYISENFDVPGAKEWSEYFRCSQIPFGCLAYMPDDFGGLFGDNGGVSYSNRWLMFSCSLKNYENEIEFFIKNVLRHIVEKVQYCYSLYEEYAYDDEGSDLNWIDNVTNWLGDLKD